MMDEPELSGPEKSQRQYELVEALMGRMQRISAKSTERLEATVADRDCHTDKCSQMVTTIEDDIKQEMKRGKRRHKSKFLPSEGASPTVTWRHASTTEKGRHLEAYIDEGAGHLFGIKKERRTSLKADGRGDRHARAKCEKRLSRNCEPYIMRDVNKLVYLTPDDAEEAERRAMEEASDEEFEQRRPPPAGSERFPIPVAATEMNPKLLLTYVCEGLVLPSGARVFKRFATCQLSCHLLVYMYWYCHCRFFQEASEKAQAHLLRRVATLYVKLLSDERFATNRDFLFRFYPYAIAASISAGFHYLCPGSRNMYITTLKRLLYRQCVTILTGADCCAESVLAMRATILPDEIDEDMDAPDSLPPLTQPESDEELLVDEFSELSVVQAPPAPITVPASAVASLIFTGPPTSDGDELLAARRAGREVVVMPPPRRRPRTPEPVERLTGARHELRFGPDPPVGRTTLLPRQPRGRFDAAARSALMDQFMEKPRLGRTNNVDRTDPVPWCTTGGVNTHVAAPRRKAKKIYAGLVKEIDAAKLSFRKDLARNASAHWRGIAELDDDERRVNRGGAAAKGRYALDRVLDFIAEEEALKERQEKARAEAEALRR